ncbi:thioredoxin family protein [Pyxidicoccus sp. 3LFB2]
MLRKSLHVRATRHSVRRLQAARRVLPSLLLLLGGACAASRPTPAPGRASASGHVLPFISDDYERALSEAREKGVPLFVDAWASWCPPCLTLKAYVLSDPKLAKHADRFVWLEVDTDLPQNEPFLEKFPLDTLPTLYVIDPRQEQVLVRAPGDTSLAQLEQLLADGERAWRAEGSGPDALLARADALHGAGKEQEASEAFSRVLAEAPMDWPHRGRALQSLLGTLMKSRQFEPCARKALEELPRLPRSPAWAGSANRALTCALMMPSENPETAALRRALDAKASEALAPPHIAMSVDDRSTLYEGRLTLRAEEGDAPGQQAVAREWLAFLEAEASRAPTPQARVSLGMNLVSAALTLEEPTRVLPLLQRNEQELPHDEAPPRHLSMLYQAMQRPDDALAAIDRALHNKAAGRVRVLLLTNRAELLNARGDRDEAVRTLEEALRVARALPQKLNMDRQVTLLEKQLTELKSAPPASPPRG